MRDISYYLVVSIILVVGIVFISCTSNIGSEKSLSIIYKFIAPEPPFGVSIIKIDSIEYVVVRTKGGYGEGLAIVRKE